MAANYDPLNTLRYKITPVAEAYLACMAGWPLEEQRDAYVRAYVSPPRMRSNAVGGGLLYFELGVGGCSYDASTDYYIRYRLLGSQ
jgi:hypothetical protein